MSCNYIVTYRSNGANEMSTNGKDLVVKGSYALSSPSQMTQMAKVLKSHIVKHQLYTNISGKNYAHVEGWQFAGGLMGIFPRLANVESLSTGTETKWKAEVELIDVRTDKILSRGIAICSNKEGKKKTFDEYAVLSMAQTRAIGKAYRNLIGWVMKLAGYESTPSEEMFKVGNELPEELKKSVKPTAPSTTDKTVKCQGCFEEGVDTLIPQNVADYSKKIYGQPLCMDHQKLAKKANA